MIMLIAHKRRLVGPIWGAILVLVLQLFPNVAFAHSGRTHHLSAAAISTLLAGEHQHQRTTENQADDTELAALNQHEIPASAVFDDCADGCCRAWSGCCAAVLASSMSNLAYLESAVEPIPLISEDCLGTKLETLARPPKTLA
jgi:hypothetical protein